MPIFYSVIQQNTDYVLCNVWGLIKKNICLQESHSLMEMWCAHNYFTKPKAMTPARNVKWMTVRTKRSWNTEVIMGTLLPFWRQGSKGPENQLIRAESDLKEISRL